MGCSALFIAVLGFLTSLIALSVSLSNYFAE